MLNSEEVRKIISTVNDFWTTSLSKDQFGQEIYEKAIGKEGGHQLADSVDQFTTERLHVTYPTLSGYQRDKSDKKCSRSMGDIWFKNVDQVWHPINVKTGIVGAEGQPNLVAMKKILPSLLEHEIDSYYLLFVKFELKHETKSVCQRVYFVDMLDWLGMTGNASVLAYDDGPGQIMLKSKKFFDCMAKGVIPPPLTMQEKAKFLIDLLEDGLNRLIKNRKAKHKGIQLKYEDFKNSGEKFTISPKQQKKLNIR